VSIDNQLYTASPGPPVCLFCGGRATEKFHSGSSETYWVCPCPESQRWYDARRAVEAAEVVATARLNHLEATRQLERSHHNYDEARVNAQEALATLMGTLPKPSRSSWAW